MNCCNLQCVSGKLMQIVSCNLQLTLELNFLNDFQCFSLGFYKSTILEESLDRRLKFPEVSHDSLFYPKGGFKIYIKYHQGIIFMFYRFTLPEIDIFALKMDGWKTTYLLGWPIFRAMTDWVEVANSFLKLSSKFYCHHCLKEDIPV